MVFFYHSYWLFSTCYLGHPVLCFMPKPKFLRTIRQLAVQSNCLKTALIGPIINIVQDNSEYFYLFNSFKDLNLTQPLFIKLSESRKKKVVFENSRKIVRKYNIHFKNFPIIHVFLAKRRKKYKNIYPLIHIYHAF